MKENSLQFASYCANTVEQKVLPYTVYPFTMEREGAASKFTTTSLQELKLLTIWPCKVMVTTAISSSACHKILQVLGSSITLLTMVPIPVALSRALQLFEHSVVFICHIFIGQSEDAQSPSYVKVASLMKRGWMQNSFGVFPHFKLWILIFSSEEALKMWLLSWEQVTPLLCSKGVGRILFFKYLF